MRTWVVVAAVEEAVVRSHKSHKSVARKNDKEEGQQKMTWPLHASLSHTQPKRARRARNLDREKIKFFAETAGARLLLLLPNMPACAHGLMTLLCALQMAAALYRDLDGTTNSQQGVHCHAFHA
jgi:hypothetical protein